MWRFYITNEALLIIEQVYLADPKDFVLAILDADSKTFIMHIAIWEQKKMSVYSKKQVKVQVRALLLDKAPIEVLAECFD